MKTRLQMVMLTFAVAAAPMLAPAPAAASDYWACVDGCAAEFDGSGVYQTSLRGWCYILRCTGE